jgi:hypothetical protein
MLGPIKPEEAFLIFEKLCSEKARVLCLGSLWGWRLTLTGAISVSGNHEVSLVAEGGEGELTLRLDAEDLLIWYSEPKDETISDGVELPENARDSSCLSLGLPLRVPLSTLKGPLKTPWREKLFFVELKEEIE